MKNTLCNRIVGSRRLAAITTAALLATFTASAARATLLFSEDFNYTIGNNLPTSPASGDNWGSSGTGSTVVSAQTLTPYTAGGLTVTSTGGQITNTNRSISHTFTEASLLSSADRANGEAIYISFVATIQNSSTDGGNADIKFSGSADVRVSIGTAWKSQTWGLSSPSGFQSAGVSTTTAALIVVKISYTDANTANFSLYVNPEATSSAGSISLLSSPSVTLTSQSFGYLNKLEIANQAAGASITIDAIKMGTSLNDVVALTSIPEPSNAALIGGAGLLSIAAFRTTRFRR